MTRLAYGGAASDERPVYTTCDNCGRALCVECLERVADKLDTFADRAVAHDVKPTPLQQHRPLQSRASVQDTCTGTLLLYR